MTQQAETALSTDLDVRVPPYWLTLGVLGKGDGHTAATDSGVENYSYRTRVP